MKLNILNLLALISVVASLQSMQKNMRDKNNISQNTQDLLALYCYQPSESVQKYATILDQASTEKDKMNALSCYIYHDLKHKLKRDDLRSLQNWIGNLVSTREGRARIIREPINDKMRIRRASELEIMQCKYLHFAQLIYKICTMNSNTLQDKGYNDQSVVYLKSVFSNNQQSEVTIPHILNCIETHLCVEYCAHIDKNIIQNFAKKVISLNGKYVNPLESSVTFTYTLKAADLKD